MKNEKANNNSNEKKEDDRLKMNNDLVNPNEIASISNLWQQYSPMAWSEIYNEYINYTRRMTEIYNEYAESSQRMTQLYKELAANAEKMTKLYKESANSTEKMTKYWLHFLRMKPLSKNKEGKQE
jgi:esterase/lipase